MACNRVDLDSRRWPKTLEQRKSDLESVSAIIADAGIYLLNTYLCRISKHSIARTKALIFVGSWAQRWKIIDETLRYSTDFVETADGK